MTVMLTVLVFLAVLGRRKHGTLLAFSGKLTGYRNTASQTSSQFGARVFFRSAQPRHRLARAPN
jgi:hypothetical protein